MDDLAEIGEANHFGYEKQQEESRSKRDIIPAGECRYFDEAYERLIKLQELDIIFWCCTGMIVILVIVTFIREKNKPTISVLGKKIFYNGNCWTSDDISFVRCTKWFERVEVYSNGKKVLTFPWELDNSELFIAWVNKCGITFEDHRMKAFQ